MRAYIPSPDLTRPMGSDVPLVKITTASNVCSDDAYTVTFPSKENQYISALQLTFTDDEADEFIEKFAAARLERIRQQEQTYEALHAKFGGTWDNALTPKPVMCEQHGGVWGDDETCVVCCDDNGDPRPLPTEGE